MNATILQYFHWYTEGDGKFYEEVKNSAGYLKETGITAVWLPPAYKAGGGGYSNGYDPYDLYDLGEFDQKGTIPTKYGTKEQYQEAVRILQENGIQVYVDIVLNHKAGGDETETFQAIKVDSEDRSKVVSEPHDITSFTKFTFPGRGKTYSDFIWDFNCFTGTDFAEGEPEGIYRIINDYTVHDGWEDVIDTEKGNYDYLMYNDIEHRNPHVREELNYWAKWYHDQIPFDGVRLDAVKHQSHEFYKEWLAILRSNTEKDIFAVGEYWAPGHLELLQRYIDATEGTMSLFDSSLHRNFHLASLRGAEYDLRQIFAGTLVEADPEHAVTVVDNHDTQPLQQLEAPVEKWFKPLAYAFILLREAGYPCLFYPDLFGGHYWDKDKEGNDQEIFLDKVDGIEQLMLARKQFAYGAQHDYFEDAHCVGWVREGDGFNRGCAVIMSNFEAYNKPMHMGEAYAGQTFYDLLGRFDEKVEIREDGWGDFPCPAGNVSVWVPEEQDEAHA